MRHRVPWRNSRPSREFRDLGNVWPWPVTRRVLLRKCRILAEVGPRPREAQQTGAASVSAPAASLLSCRFLPTLADDGFAAPGSLNFKRKRAKGAADSSERASCRALWGRRGQCQGSSLVTGTVPLVRDGDGVRTESVPVRPAQDPAGEEVAERPGRPRGTGSKGPGTGQARRQRHTCGRWPGTATLAVPGPFSARWCSPGFHAKLLCPNGSCSTLNSSWTDARCPRLCSEASGRHGPSA